MAALPWRIVKRAKIGGREPVCRLEDLLDELPTALLNIDVKAGSAIEPLISEHTSAHIRAGHAPERWRRIAISAAKQCRRAVVPPCSAAVQCAASGPGGVPKPGWRTVEVTESC